MCETKESLQKTLDCLLHEKIILEYSDDFCYTNGKMKSLNNEIYIVSKKLQELSKDK